MRVLVYYWRALILRTENLRFLRKVGASAGVGVVLACPDPAVRVLGQCCCGSILRGNALMASMAWTVFCHNGLGQTLSSACPVPPLAAAVLGWWECLSGHSGLGLAILPARTTLL